MIYNVCYMLSTEDNTGDVYNWMNVVKTLGKVESNDKFMDKIFVILEIKKKTSRLILPVCSSAYIYMIKSSKSNTETVVYGQTDLLSRVSRSGHFF